MTNLEFAAWRQQMGWTVVRCAIELGATRPTIYAWERPVPPVRIPLYIALACAALAKGVEPIGGRKGYRPLPRPVGRPRLSAGPGNGVPK